MENRNVLRFDIEEKESIVIKCLFDQECVVSENIENDAKYNKYIDSANNKCLSNMCCIPISMDKDGVIICIGVLALYDQEIKSSYSIDDKDVIQRLCTILAPTINNLRYEENFHILIAHSSDKFSDGS